MQELEKILEEIDFLDIIYDVDNGGCLLRHEDVVDVIRKHMNDGWIPVEDRLPKGDGNDGELIVTDKDGRVWSGIYYGITEETDEEPCFHKWDEEMWHCYKPDVIAWRPLPEPYRPESETEKPDWRQDMLRKFDRRE